MTATPAAALLEARQVSKSYGGVHALADVSLAVRAGEVVGLVGDNGAGKSTLMKILCGALRPDSGTVAVDGEPVTFHSTRDATRAGISVVFQTLALVDVRDACHNFFLGREPRRGPFVDRRRMEKEMRATLTRLRVKVPPAGAPVGLLSGGQRQAIAVARAVHQGGRVILMDEPTAALGVQEQRRTLDLVRDLRESGTTVVIVSHNLAHVFEVADRIVVLRGGRIAGERAPATSHPDEVVRLIVGADAAGQGAPR